VNPWAIFAAQWMALSLALYFAAAWVIKPAVRLVADSRRRAGVAGPMRGPRLVRYETVLRLALLCLGVASALLAPWEVPVAAFWDVALGVTAMGLSTVIHTTVKRLLPAAIAARLGLSTPLRDPEAAPSVDSSPARSLADIETLGG